jgi:hypothetical protein
VSEAAEILPIPPRYRWTKRIAKCLLVIFVLCAILRVGWGVYAQRRLDRAIAESRRANEPFFAADFKQPALRPTENAVEILQNAPPMSQTQAQYQALYSFIDFETVSPADANQIRQWVAANAAPRGALRSARGLPANWEFDPTDATYNTVRLYRAFSPIGELTELARAAALAAHADGDDPRAVEYFRDILDAGRVIRAHPSLIAHTVACYNDRAVFRVILERSQELRLTPPAARAATEKLLAELLDESDFHRSLVRATASTRLTVLHFYQNAADGRATLYYTGASFQPPPGLAERAVTFTLAPAFRLNAARAVHRMTAELDAVSQFHDYRSLLARIPEIIPTRTTVHPADLVMAFGEQSGTIAPVLGNHFNTLALRRAAAMALAIRLFRDDHGGALPARAQDLVPAYMPKVPTDPFDPAGGDLRYMPRPKRPIIYSVGKDGVDDLANNKWSLPAQHVPLDYRSPDDVYELRPDLPINPATGLPPPIPGN